MARTLRYSNAEAQFPLTIWAQRVNNSAYVLNRTGNSSYKGYESS